MNMKMVRNGPLALVIGVPLAAVIMGIVTLVLAFGNPDRPVRETLPALDKRSWVEVPGPDAGDAAAALPPDASSATP